MSVDTVDTDLYRTAFRGLLEDGSAPESFLDRLAELGWAELAADDPATATGLLFEEQGRRRVATPALDLVVARALGVELAGDEAVLHARGAAPAVTEGDDGQLVVDGLLLAGGGRATTVVAPAPGGVFRWDLGALDVAPVAGLDPDLGLRSVRGTRTGGPVEGGGWDAAVVAARRALAHELLGVAEAMLDLAVGQVTERHQFDRPIAVFQTVKHRLAEVKVAVEGARGALTAAWRGDDALTADVAKGLAGRATLLAAKNAQQVCGAIGFTVEHPLPGLVRRGYVLDALYGSTSTLQERLGSRILAEGAVPRLPTPW